MVHFGCVSYIKIYKRTKDKGLTLAITVTINDVYAFMLFSFSVKCSQKTVKDAYHIICKPCSLLLEICCKCGKKDDIVVP